MLCALAPGQQGGQAHHHGTAEIRTYRGVIRQIERRLKEIQEAEQIAASALVLRQVIAVWKKDETT